MGYKGGKQEKHIPGLPGTKRSLVAGVSLTHGVKHISLLTSLISQVAIEAQLQPPELTTVDSAGPNLCSFLVKTDWALLAGT